MSFLPKGMIELKEAIERVAKASDLTAWQASSLTCDEQFALSQIEDGMSSYAWLLLANGSPRFDSNLWGLNDEEQQALEHARARSASRKALLTAAWSRLREAFYGSDLNGYVFAEDGQHVLVPPYGWVSTTNDYAHESGMLHVRMPNGGDVVGAARVYAEELEAQIRTFASTAPTAQPKSPALPLPLRATPRSVEAIVHAAISKWKADGAVLSERPTHDSLYALVVGERRHVSRAAFRNVLKRVQQRHPDVDWAKRGPRPARPS